MTKKLNFGCGPRVAPGWANIDFHAHPLVQRVNLLDGFPFPDNYFDFVYSSHVVEHFTLEEAAFLIREAHRVLKPAGVIRTVVPDLEETAREYLRILDLPDSTPDKPNLYEWIKIELLDQLVRSFPGGAMGHFFQSVIDAGDSQMLTYIRTRTETAAWMSASGLPQRTLTERLMSLTRNKVSQRLIYLYLAAVKTLIPRRLRSMVVNESGIGERHRWMYDRYGMTLLMETSGFVDISFCRFNESRNSEFLEDSLDSNANGSSYKNVSIYCEARKNANRLRGTGNEILGSGSDGRPGSA